MADAALVVIAAPAGVEVGTELVWQFIESADQPRMLCVNKMDKEHADFRKCLDGAASVLGARVVPVVIPIGAAESFKGVIDLIEQKAYITDDSGKTKKEDIPADMADEVAELIFRLSLV